MLVASFLSAIVAGLIRFGLLPYLREQLQATREIHQQVTAGPSATDEPSTLREELSELRAEVGDVKHRTDQHAGELDDAVLELRAMALMFDGHLDWSAEQVEWSQAQVDALWAELGRQRAAGLRPDFRHSHKHRKDTP